MELPRLVAVLALAASAGALQCYTCQSKREVPGYQRSVDRLRDPLHNFPPCEEFDPYFEDMNRKFIQNCPPTRNKTCLKITDPNDYTNVLRTCHPVGKPVTSYDSYYGTCTELGACYCDTDLCNGSERGWPSAVLLLSAVIAALLGGR
ncbi:uncharacterized protein LOC122380418 [Amphibalanus amphitrite]|uniref:uncharacterized protein LOC122380418 n=1 Tax=Amphibalanus amphitrite TaxID=1232801 RepID=UPI001C90ABE7|nr:uncharacterized protein LOC122380418 [Amphibalanus amphitrite]